VIAVRAASDGAAPGGVCSTVDGVGLPHGGAKAGIVADPLMPAPATTADLTGRSVGVGFGRG
jgi:hypothetical protein